jgi:hypothetical protein
MELSTSLEVTWVGGTSSMSFHSETSMEGANNE